MPSIKDLFGNKVSSKVLSSTNIAALTSSGDVESYNYAKAYEHTKNRFFPEVDYTKPEKFAKYGSAQKYYIDSLKRIYRMYPYDGSHKEKLEWHNSSSYLDNYIFEKEYPRTNGYLDFYYGGSVNSFSTALEGGYITASLPQYITIQGGPHPASTVDGFDDLRTQDFKTKSSKSSYMYPAANIYDPGKRRASNFTIDGTRGNTVECWTNLDTLKPGSFAYNSALFDLWNGPHGGYPLSNPYTALRSASYGRLLIEKRVPRNSMVPLTGNLHVTYMSGTHGAERVPILLTASVGTITASGNWNHVAVSVKNSGLSGADDGLEIKSYLNGDLIETFLTGTSIGEVTGALNAHIGSYRYFPNPNVKSNALSVGFTDFNGWGTITGSVDEFRFWKTRRSSKEIGRNWFTQVYGGTNTDDANTDLGVYYKFNEGITQTASIDQTVLDYSGRISNGSITNYTSSMRSLQSAMVLAEVAETEFKDPIVYSFHPDVKTLRDDKKTLGYEYDFTNNASIINSFPDWIVDEDEIVGGGHFANIVQLVAQYFDNLQAQMDYLNRLRDIEYTKYMEISAVPYADGGSVFNDSNVSMAIPYSASFLGKPLPFSSHLLKSVGVVTPELFSEATALEAISSRDENEIFEKDITEVKNQIYQNIYNNLNYIFKSKGTEKSFRNLIRCFGIDEEVLKINFYGDNVPYKIRDNFHSIATKKTYIDFNDTDRFGAVVYQMTSSQSPYDSNAVYSFIPSPINLISSGGFGMTFQTEVFFPKKYPGAVDYEPYNELSSSLFGMHTAIYAAPGSSGQANITWATPDISEFQVYAVKDVLENNFHYAGDTYFQLTSSALGINLTSSVFTTVYDNEKWNLAVRIKPTKYPWVNSISGTTSGSSLINADSVLSYDISFYGVNTDLDIVSNEFEATTTISASLGDNFLSGSKRLYLGAHRTNYTGSLLARSDAKISSTRAWMDYLTNDEITAHSKDAGSHGVLHPYRNSFAFQTGSGINSYYIPRSDLRILEWDFSQITSSDAGSGDTSVYDGQFQIQDISSGSTEGNYADWITDNRYGSLREVLRNQYAAVGNLFPINNANVAQREYIHSAKLVPPEVINSSDMINILNQDDLEFTKESRPIDYFMAIEKSMYQTISEEMLKMFATVKDFNNLIGDPVNRYRGQYKNMNKLRSLFFERIENSPDLDKYVEFYKWIDSAITVFLEQLFPASANYSENMRTLVENTVLERSSYRTKFPTLEMKQEDPETSMLGINELLYNWELGHAPNPGGIPSPQNENCLWWNQRAERDAAPLSQSAVGVSHGRNKILDVATTENSGTYLKRIQGSTYVLRKLSRPYKLTIKDDLKQFKNKGKNKDFYKAKINEFGANNSISFAGDIFTDPEMDCNDNNGAKYKQKLKFQMQPSDDSNGYKGGLIAPFNLYYNSPPATSSIIAHEWGLSPTQIDIVDLHTDYYGTQYEVPMQGPFTEKYVGGNQYRHAPINYLSNTRNLDTYQTRPEGFVIDLENERIHGPEFGMGVHVHRPRATHYRDEVSKRPLNIKNILQTTATIGTRLSGTILYGPIGNYSKQYEMVQTSGRKANNKYFVEAEGVGFGWIPTDSEGATISRLVASPDLGILRQFMFLGMAYPTISPPRRDGGFTMPTRTVYDTVFVERFSAPGSFDATNRGCLDPFAEEFSVYNALPFRNWGVRGPRYRRQRWITPPEARFQPSASIWSTSSLGLQSLLTRHTNWGGYDYESSVDNPINPAYHKTNRNRLLRMELSGSSSLILPSGKHSEAYVTGAQYDNWWVQHMIPQSDFQYAWIAASVLSTDPSNAFGFGYFPASGRVSSSAGGFESAVNFVSASELGSYYNTSLNYRLKSRAIYTPEMAFSTTKGFIPNDFIGLNTNIYEPITSSFTNNYTTTFPDDSGNTLGYPEQIINSSTDFNYKGGLIRALTSGPPLSTLGARLLNGLLHHRNGPYGWPSWKQNRTGQTPIPRYHRRNNIISISVRKYPAGGQITPTAFPALVVQAYDHEKNLDNQESFGFQWDYKWGPVYTENFIEPPVTSKYFPMRHTFDTTNELDPNTAPLYHELIIDHTYANNRGAFANVTLQSRVENAGYAPPSHDSQIFAKLVDLYAKGIVPQESNPIKAFKNLVYKETIYPKERFTYLAKTRGRTKYTEESSVLKEPTYINPLGGQISQGGIARPQRTFWKDFLPDRLRTGGAARNSLDYKILNTDALNKYGQGVTYAGGQIRATDLSVWPLDTGTRRIPAVLDYSNLSGSNHGQLSVNVTTETLADVNAGTSKANATASFAYEYHNKVRIKLPHNFVTDGAFVAGDEVRQVSFIPDWQTAKLAKKNPWFDSYEDFAQDIRCFGKEYTVLPEYRISDHMDLYLTHDNFKIANNKFLSLEGGALSESARAPALPFDANFFNEYCHSDFLKFFEIVRSAAPPVGGNNFMEFPDRSTQITLKCHGIKKLLPYNGFYPVNRTIQLGNLFSQSFGSKSYLTGSDIYGSNPNTERLASAMQPFFNPGILFNTIKSGMAVDWLAFTGSKPPAYKAEAGGLSQEAYISSGSISSSFRFPFESLVDPSIVLPQPTEQSYAGREAAALYYLDTTNRKVSPSNNHVTSAFGIYQGTNTSHYTLAMNNFLGETARFFLEGWSSQPWATQQYHNRGKLKNLISEQEGKIKPFVSGVTYYMDLVCYKTDDLVMYEGPFRVTGSIGTDLYNEFSVAGHQNRGTHYGPIVGVTASAPQTPPLGHIQEASASYRWDPTTAPYTPPYFYGTSVTTFAFKPHEADILFSEPGLFTETQDFTMEQIIGYLETRGTVHYNKYNRDASGRLESARLTPPAHIRGEVADTFEDYAIAAKLHMNNASSFNLFDVVKLPTLKFDVESKKPVIADESVANTYWSISPKFECPVLNFSGTESTVPDIWPAAADGYDYNTRGMWRGYGSIPGNASGIFFELKETYPKSLYAAQGAANYNPLDPFKPGSIPVSASLLQHLGFNKYGSTKRKIGSLADKREITEAVIAIPFKEKDNEKRFFPILSADDPGQLAVLSRRVVEAILGNAEPLPPEVYIPGPSIVDMVQKMERYVFPPNLDFVTNKSVLPFCMYIFDFTHTFDKQDLADIWQGVMPKIAMTAEKQTSTISHFLTNNELLNGTKITPDLRWMVFKVKQKAEKSYYGVTLSTTDDDRFKFDFDVGSTNTNLTTPKYSYNWPYDFCSLVELAKINTSVQLGGNVPITPPDIASDFAPTPLQPGIIMTPGLEQAEDTFANTNPLIQGGSAMARTGQGGVGTIVAAPGGMGMLSNPGAMMGASTVAMGGGAFSKGGKP